MNEIIKKINKLAENYSGYTALNLSKSVKIKSISRHEKNIQIELMRQMIEAGFDEVRIDGLGNVIGRIGDGKRILVFDGHTDTVDIGNTDNWHFDPFSGEIKNGYVHGRGAVDQKGGLAAMVTSGRILKELGFNRDLTIYFTGSVMEEDCEGLCWKYMIEEEKLKPDYVIITEPGNLCICRGHRGRIEIVVKFRGKSCHGSAPGRGVNAVYMAARAALEIEKLNNKLCSDDFLGKATITVSEIKSESPSLCAVPDYAQLHIDRRLTPGETKESAVAEIEEIVKVMDARVEVLHYDETSFTGLKYGMEKYFPAWNIDTGSPLVSAGIKVFEEVFKTEPLIDNWSFSTNGAIINGHYGIPVIGFGPGDETLAHAPNEKVSVNQLVAASAFYAAFAFTV